MRRICIDGFNLALTKGSGIATYGRNLNQALREMGYETEVLHGPRGRIGRNNLLNEVVLEDAQVHENSELNPSHRPKRSDVAKSPWGRVARRVVRSGHVLPSPATERALTPVTWAAQDVFRRASEAYERFGAFTPVYLGYRPSQRPDLMHWTSPLPIHVRGLPNIYTLHDMVPLRLPFTTLDFKRVFYGMCKTICRSADHIVTVSESARTDIIRFFKVPEDRITNTYQAVSLPPALLQRSDEEIAAEVEGVFGLGWKRYFLFYGAIEPKKNLGRIIEAYMSSGVTDPLVIIGGAAWLDEYETKLLYEDLVRIEVLKEGVLRRSDRIRRYEYLPFHSLVSLVRGAKATLFPSVYEGFGLPVLESMLVGTPVLTSTSSSLPEVAGDAALMVEATDVDAITRGIRALDADADLRAELSAKGPVQAAKFSPEAYKNRLAALYDRLM